MNAEQAQTATMTAQAVDQLRNDILSGDLPPGSKLKINELQRRYGLGSSPIREGLSLLVSDGLVERIHSRGFRVPSVSLEAFAELLKTRQWLEETALRESILHGDAQWEERVVLAHHRLAREARWLNGQRGQANPEWENAHRDFHLTLISACGSSWLLGYCEQLYDQNIRYRHLAGSDSRSRRPVADEHRELCDAVTSRDFARAVDCLKTHYRLTGDHLQRQLAANTGMPMAGATS